MSREAENFYKRGIPNIFVLSYALTYKYELTLIVGRNPSRISGLANSFGIRVCALTSKGRSVCLLQRHRGWILRIASLVRIEEQHSTVIPSDSHSGFYFPPAAGWSHSLSREGNVSHAPQMESVSILVLCKKRTFHFPPRNLRIEDSHRQQTKFAALRSSSSLAYSIL